MVCEECKYCWNYQVSEVGCFGREQPCECYITDDCEYEYDPCEDCRINGDDFFENEDGELESYCDQCAMNYDEYDFY